MPSDNNIIKTNQVVHSEKNPHKRASTIAKCVVSAGLMVWLLTKADINQIISHWDHVNWIILILLSILLNIGVIFFKAVRLQEILAIFNIKPPILWLGILHLKANFIKNFFPGGVSGEIYKTFVLARNTGESCKTISTVMLEKVVGAGSMLILAIIGFVFGRFFWEIQAFKKFDRPVLIMTFILLFLLLSALFTVKSRWPNRISINSNIWNKIVEIYGYFLFSFSRNSENLKIIATSLIIQIIVIFWYFVLSNSIGFNLNFSVMLITIPLIELLLMLPVSIGGIGVREGAFVFFYMPFGLTIEEAIAFSLLSLVLGTIIRILSGTVFLFNSESSTNIKP